MPQMEALFYLILASQIFLLSYHYPMAYVKRVKYILDNHPPKDYPKLYPTDIYVKPEDITRKRIEFFKYLNFTVGLIGIAIIITGIVMGFELHDKGGAEIFVVMYLLLQFIPHFILEIYQYRHYKHMRTLSVETKRSAEFTVRKLSNFISPFWVILAAILFVANIVLFLYYEGFENAWTEEVYITVITSTAVNIMFFVISYKAITGKKLDPLQAHENQMANIKSTIGIMVFASIMMSVFLISVNSGREFGLDKWDPIMMSVYFQFIIVFGIGKQLRGLKIEDVNFDVYKADGKAEA